LVPRLEFARIIWSEKEAMSIKNKPIVLGMDTPALDAAQGTERATPPGRGIASAAGGRSAPRGTSVSSRIAPGAVTGSAATPSIAWDYLWFGGEPLAQINNATGEVLYYFNDHLGTPILQTSQTAQVVWRAEYDCSRIIRGSDPFALSRGAICPQTPQS